MERSLRWMGTVTRPHGVRGEVKVRPETDDVHRFEDLGTLFVGSDEATAEPYAVRSVAFQPMGSGIAVLLGLAGVADRDAAEGLSGRMVFADESDLPPLEDGEYYLGDLVGLKATDAVGTHLGLIVDVLELPAQPVLVLERTDGVRVMVPLVDEFVESVDTESGVLVLLPIEGLLDPDAQEEA